MRAIELTDTQLAGQRVIYAYAGRRPPRELLDALRAGEAAGVIFFGPNVEDETQIRAVCDELTAAAGQSPLGDRPLLMVDQEGGMVRRLPGEPVPSAKEVGQASDSARLAAVTGHAAARQLRGAGMNLNLAPVLDVHRQPDGFQDHFRRSYSSDPAVVSRLATSFLQAQQANGIAATAKHFPGLGAAEREQNTDLCPVTLDVSVDELRELDQAPFRAAVEAGVELVMPSWAVYPALDPDAPAGLSPAIIEGELRGRLGFTGVTISDGIDAGAVLGYGDLAQRAIRAAAAGADLILCGATAPEENTPAQGAAVARALAAALGRGELDRARTLAAVDRVLALKARH